MNTKAHRPTPAQRTEAALNACLELGASTHSAVAQALRAVSTVVASQKKAKTFTETAEQGLLPGFSDLGTGGGTR